MYNVIISIYQRQSLTTIENPLLLFKSKLYPQIPFILIKILFIIIHQVLLIIDMIVSFLNKAGLHVPATRPSFISIPLIHQHMFLTIQTLSSLSHKAMLIKTVLTLVYQFRLIVYPKQNLIERNITHQRINKRKINSLHQTQKQIQQMKNLQNSKLEYLQILMFKYQNKLHVQILFLIDISKYKPPILLFTNFLLEILQQTKMRVQDSYYSNPLSSQSMKEVKDLMQNIKTPFLNKIQHAKSHFNQQVQNFKLNTPSEPTLNEYPSNHQQKSFQNINKGLKFQQLNVDQPRILTQSSCDEISQQLKEPYFRQWTKGSKENGFAQMSKLLQHYHKVFDKKTKFSKTHGSFGESFKIQQKQIIEQIFYEIGDVGFKTVEFSKIIQFFEKCSLFYLIYNIHPDSLLMTLKETAHYFNDKLTEEEFMDLFLLNTRTNMEYQNFNTEKTLKKCILSQQHWKDLKEIFIIFDTFGNETIQLKQFFQKLRTSIQYKHLLQLEVIYYPCIKRSYRLKKILFELETKKKLGQSFVKWQQIKQHIINFVPAKGPTIDIVYKEAISSGKITNNNNSFMVKDQILTFIKNIFSKCPKYCEHFIKISHYCQEINDSEESKLYLNQIVRNIPIVNTFKDVLKQMANQKLKYLDLDQILERFSLKAIENQTQKVKNFYELWNKQQNSDDEQQVNNRILSQKQNKKISNNRKSNYKYQPKKQTTVIKEFALTKKTKSSIRDRRVQEMIQEIKQKQREQSKKKFKANPIPSSINNEKYNQYKQQMAKNKQSILRKLNETSLKDMMLVKYLEANTKLFDTPKDFTTDRPINQYQFQAKPIPWYVHTNLLQAIQEEKQQKRKMMKKQTKCKYLRQWKNLPTFINADNAMITSHQYITKQGTEEGILCQLQNVKIQPQTNKQIRHKIKVKQVPNFQQLHQQFIQSLEKRKNAFTPTKIIEFNLTSPKKQQPLKQKISSCKHSNSYKILKPEINSNFIGSTLKYESLVKLNKQKKQLLEKQKQQQVQKELQRIKSQQLFAKLLRKQLKKQQKSSCFSNRSKKSRVASQENINNQKQLAKMYKRVFERPFLFQSSPNSNFRTSSSKPEPVKIRDDKYQINQLIEEIQPHELAYYSKNVNNEEVLEPQSNQSI